MTPTEPGSYRLRGPGGSTPRTGAVIAVALAVAFLVWLLFIQDDDEEPATTAGQPAAEVEALGPNEANPDDIVDLQEEAGHPIYWAGEIDGTKIELTRTTDANVYVRYLSEDAEVGEGDPFLTVSTYPFDEAYGALEVVSNRPGSSSERLEDGALAVRNGEEATSVYLAYPDEDVQVEVYDPDPARAFEVATSGDIQPIE